MRLTLDIDLDTLGDGAAAEAGRTLRYWAGALAQMDLRAPVEFPLMDSTSQTIGHLALSQGEDDTTGAVKDVLTRYLHRLHETLLWKVDGLGERDARWPMTPTGTNLLGLLKHVASVESEYFGVVFDRPFPLTLPWSGDDAPDNADMWAWAEETIGSVRDLATAVWAHADATIDELDLDATGHVPWWGEDPVTFAHVLVHVVVELARHLGQADIVRELTDGSCGLMPAISNLPEHDSDWWSDYVEKLKQVAEAAD